jgi:hypothetical protein
MQFTTQQDMRRQQQAGMAHTKGSCQQAGTCVLSDLFALFLLTQSIWEQIGALYAADG